MCSYTLRVKYQVRVWCLDSHVHFDKTNPERIGNNTVHLYYTLYYTHFEIAAKFDVKLRIYNENERSFNRYTSHLNTPQ